MKLTTYKRLNGNMFTPLGLFKSLKANFLLESASLKSVKGRYSLIVKSINFGILKENDKYFFKSDILDPKKYDLSESYDLTILKEFQRATQNQNLDFLKILDVFRNFSGDLIQEELKELPLPLGGLGYLGYEFFNECETFSFSKESLYNAPNCYFVFPKECIIFDHFYDEIYIIVSSYKGINIDLELILNKLEKEVLNANVQNSIQSTEIKSKIIYEDDKKTFLKNVDFLKNEIYQGRFLQCVISRAIAVKSNIEPLEFYEKLRRSNPSPYMFYLNFNDFYVIGASPEVMIECKYGISRLRPIAGTKKRGISAIEDKELECELLNDEKEAAEHLMLVDLARNDLGSSAEIGSVKVSAFRHVEYYSSVIHIVSEVTAKIDSKYTTQDCLKRSFPAGTVSGAPKIESIKAINELEKYSRNIYGGAICYFKHNGDLDSAITIRTAVFQNDVYYLRAGAGIVMDSVPESEYLETISKMKSLLDILKIKT